MFQHSLFDLLSRCLKSRWKRLRVYKNVMTFTSSSKCLVFFSTSFAFHASTRGLVVKRKSLFYLSLYWATAETDRRHGMRKTDQSNWEGCNYTVRTTRPSAHHHSHWVYILIYRSQGVVRIFFSENWTLTKNKQWRM